MPNVGTYISIALPTIVGLTSGDPILGVWVLLWGIVYQQIENLTFEPRISARAVDVHPAVSFGSAILGAQLFGLAGALLAVPLAATGMAMLEIYKQRYELTAQTEEKVAALVEPARPAGGPGCRRPTGAAPSPRTRSGRPRTHRPGTDDGPRSGVGIRLLPRPLRLLEQRLDERVRPRPDPPRRPGDLAPDDTDDDGEAADREQPGHDREGDADDAVARGIPLEDARQHGDGPQGDRRGPDAADHRPRPQVPAGYPAVGQQPSDPEPEHAGDHRADRGLEGDGLRVSVCHTVATTDRVVTMSMSRNDAEDAGDLPAPPDERQPPGPLHAAPDRSRVAVEGEEEEHQAQRRRGRGRRRRARAC